MEKRQDDALFDWAVGRFLIGCLDNQLELSREKLDVLSREMRPHWSIAESVTARRAVGQKSVVEHRKR